METKGRIILLFVIIIAFAFGVLFLMGDKIADYENEYSIDNQVLVNATSDSIVYYDSESDSYQAHIYGNGVNLETDEGDYQLYAEATDFKVEPYSFTLEWLDDREVEFNIYIKKDGEKTYLSDLTDEEFKELNFTTNMEDQFIGFYYDHKLNAVGIDAVGYDIVTKGIECIGSQKDYILSCGQQTFSYSQAVNEQNLSVLISDNNVEYSGEDLSYIDPTVTLSSYSGGGSSTCVAWDTYSSDYQVDNEPGGTNQLLVGLDEKTNGVEIWRCYVYFDTTSLSTDYDITGVEFEYNVNYIDDAYSSSTCDNYEAHKMDEDDCDDWTPNDQDEMECMYDAIDDGSEYADDSSVDEDWNTFDFDSGANSQLESDVASGHNFFVGLMGFSSVENADEDCYMEVWNDDRVVENPKLVVQYTVDNTAPVTTATATADGDPYSYNTWSWYNVINTLSCSDDDSGCDYTKYCNVGSCIPSSTYSSPVTISSEGTTYFRYRSWDNMGNEESIKQQKIKIDKTDPVTVASGVGATSGNVYLFNGETSAEAINITLTMSDYPSGMNFMKYCIDTDNTCTPDIYNNIPDGGSAVTFEDNLEGTSYVRYLSRDNAGRETDVENKTILINTHDNITLNAPEDNSLLDDTPLEFNVSYFALNDEYNFTNITINLWDGNDTLYNQTTKVVTGSDNSTLINVTIIDVDEYTWNAEACKTNSTGSVFCEFAENNRSFSWGFDASNTTYNPTAYETDTQQFNVSIDISFEVLSSLPTLIYDNSSYTGSGICTATGETEAGVTTSTCNLTATIDIPLVTSGDAQNKSFYWDITLIDSLGASLDLTTDPEEQEISKIIIGEKGGIYDGDDFLAIYSYWENDSSSLSTDLELSIPLYLGSGSVTRDLLYTSPSPSDAYNFSVASDQNSLEFKTGDGVIEYSSSSENTNVRYYYLTESSLSNQTTLISLYNLPAVDTTNFIVKGYYADYEAIGNAIVHVNRFYTGEGTEKEVQQIRLDYTGEGVGYFIEGEVEYSFTITKNGSLIDSISRAPVVCELDSSGNCILEFIVGIDTGNAFSDFEGMEGVEYSINYDEENSLVSFIYIDTLGTANYGKLEIWKRNSNGADSLLNSSILYSSAGTIALPLDNELEGNFYAKAFISRSPAEVVTIFNIILEGFTQALGKTGLLWTFFILLALGVLGLSLGNPATAVIMLVAGYIFLFLLGIGGISILSIIIIITLGIIISWLIRS